MQAYLKIGAQLKYTAPLHKFDWTAPRWESSIFKRVLSLNNINIGESIPVLDRGFIAIWISPKWM